MEIPELTGHERVLKRSEIISTRSDTRGVITFLNDTFTAVTGYDRAEAMGRPLSLIHI